MSRIFLVWLLCVLQVSAADWRLALPGWQFEFPRDHHQHPEFKTEWWYFTGRLEDESGDVFGYQITFFRQGLRPLADRGGTTSRFIVDDLKFAHFAISDIHGQRFHFSQKRNRGAFGEAGFSDSDRLAWIENWTLQLKPDGAFALHAEDEAAELQLRLENTKPFVVHGENGISQKADGVGRASHYYSGTRLATTGSLVLGGKSRPVHGESWLDREWGSNQLAPNQVGWNWFSLQFTDGTELMLYQMRLKDGGLDPNSSGTFVDQNGASQHLRRDDYQLVPTKYWTSKSSGGRYPISWQLTVPKVGLHAEISTPLESQELVLEPIAYWEGLVEIQGTRNAAAVRGHGYMELTGYAGPLVGLSE
ncbi:MAG TPA: lipocalin-like domain-containing protein [Chthoniobacter sp.]|jgi:predicted secreted hydrolase